MTARSKIERQINDGYSDAVTRFMLDRFDMPTTTSWNLFSGRLVTTAADHKLFKKHRDALADFERGYCAAQEAAQS